VSLVWMHYSFKPTRKTPEAAMPFAKAA